MLPRLLRLVAVSATLAVAASAAEEILLAGRIDGDNYVSPTGEFKIPIPVLPQLGGIVTDTDNVVTFNDNFDTHISIACFPLDASQKWELDTRGLRDYLLYFFNDFVMVDFKSRFPGAAVESARYLPELMNGTMITYALLPGGSFFEGKNRVLDAPPDNPVTAKRGTLLFVRNRHIFVISTELAERATQRSTYRKTVEEENQILGERLTALANRLILTGAKAPGQ